MRLFLLGALSFATILGCGDPSVSVVLADPPYTQLEDGRPVLRVGETVHVLVSRTDHSSLVPERYLCNGPETALAADNPALVAIAEDQGTSDAAQAASSSKRFAVTGLGDGNVVLVGACGSQESVLALRIGRP